MTQADRNDRYRDNFYLLTGEVIREWAKLELSLSKWLTDLLGIDELRARMIWDSYGDFRGKMNLLKTLTRNFADESLWPDAKKIFADVEKIAENRYILPHAFGDVDEMESKLTFFSEKFDSDYVVNFTQEKSVDTDVLKGWIKDIGDGQSRVVELKQKLGTSVYEDSLMHRRTANS